MSLKTNRVREIDALRGLAIFMVVLGHSIIVYPVNLHENRFWLTVFDLVSSVHLPLFYMISGYCFSIHGDYFIYIKKKIRRLLIPYLFFNFLDLGIRSLFPFLVNRQTDLVTALKSILLYGGEYQFIFILFLIFTIYPVIFRINKKKEYAVFIEIGLLLLALGNVKYHVFCIDLICRYLIYFNTGVLVRLYLPDVFSLRSDNNKRFFLSSIVLFLLWIGLSCYERVLNLSIYSFLITVVGILFAYSLTRFIRFVDHFEEYGHYSLQLFLLNGFALTFSRTLICKLTEKSLCIVLFNMAVDFYLCFFIIKALLSRFRIISVLMGMENR